MLKNMFELQDKLNKRLGVDAEEMQKDETERIKWILTHVLSLRQEISELVDSIPWKHWKKNQEFDNENLKVEVVDCFHFLISIAQVVGMSAKDVYDLYVSKNKTNHKRQDNGY